MLFSKVYGHLNCIGYIQIPESSILFINRETLSGKIKLKVNPETQNGTKIRLKGKGFPVYKQDGSFGDLYVTYTVKMPVNLSEKQKELFKQLAES